MGENGLSQDLQTVWATYTAGSITFGMQKSEVNNTAATADEEATAFAASIAVNENFSISAGAHDVDMGAGKVDEESRGVSASYTMGSTTIGFVANSTDNVAGTTGSDDSYREIAVSFAF
jgi:hypothetical protein